MTNAARCLEALRIEELAAQLRSDHFDVIVHPSGPDEGIDILARKSDRTIAIEVKAGSNLRISAESLRKLRRRARECGYEFCLDVVNPPREVKVRVEGLTDEFLGYLQEHPPAELAGLPAAVVEDVNRLKYDRVEITAGGMRLSGVGMVDAYVPGPRPADGANDFLESFPFRFDVTLGCDRRLSEVHSIQVDVSEYVK